MTSREATAEECPNGGIAYTLDRTWQEIYDAFPNVYVTDTPSTRKLLIINVIDKNLYFEVSLFAGAFLTDSADGYPSSLLCDGGPSPS